MDEKPAPGLALQEFRSQMRRFGRGLRAAVGIWRKCVEATFEQRGVDRHHRGQEVVAKAPVGVKHRAAGRVVHIDGRVETLEHGLEALVGTVERAAQPGKDQRKHEKRTEKQGPIPVEVQRAGIRVSRAEDCDPHD